MSQPPGLAARPPAILTPVVALALVEACRDGLALADAGGVLVLVNERMRQMFGYDRPELLGSPLERLFPAGALADPVPWRAGREPGAGLAAAMRLPGLRRDGTTFLAEVSLSALTAEAAELIVAVVRDVTATCLGEEPVVAPGAAVQEPALGLADAVVGRLFQVGLVLKTTAEQPTDPARSAVRDAAAQLDELVRQIRGFALAARTRGTDRW